MAAENFSATCDQKVPVLAEYLSGVAFHCKDVVEEFFGPCRICQSVSGAVATSQVERWLLSAQK